MAEYSRAVLKVIVAQICQSIGWQSVHTSVLEVMVDLLDEYLWQIAKISHNYAEVLGRTEVHLDDIGIIFQHMNIDLSQLAEYVKSAGLISCVIQVPKYPIPREDHLNLMYPGSREIRKRPKYVSEHLPPYPNFPETELSDEKRVKFKNDENINTNNQVCGVIKRPGDSLFNDFASEKRAKLTNETQLIRKVRSVVMTTSGVLSSVCEGKLPESSNPPQIDGEYYEESEISIIDEPMCSYKNQNSVSVLPVTEFPKMVTNTESQEIFSQSLCYTHSQDKLILPETPGCPMTSEIKIVKVESLANFPEEWEKLSKISETTAPKPFPIFPMTANGPGLIPYSIHPVPNLFTLTQSNLKKKQMTDTNKQTIHNNLPSCIQNDLLPNLKVDSSGAYSVNSHPSPVVNPGAPEKFEDIKKPKERSRKNKSKKEKRAERSEKRREEMKKKKKKERKEEEVTIVYPLDTHACKSSVNLQQAVKEPVEDKKDKIRLKIPSNLWSTPIITSDSSEATVKEKKKSEAGAEARKNLTKSLSFGHPVKKVTFKLPKKVDEAAGSDWEIVPPIVVKKKKIKSAEVKKTSKTVKKKKKSATKEVPAVAPKFGSNDERIWICPACGRVDCGTPMIGCDDCDDWYHWVCIGMRVPPPREANWYCRPCLAKKRMKSTGGKKK